MTSNRHTMTVAMTTLIGVTLGLAAPAARGDRGEGCPDHVSGAQTRRERVFVRPGFRGWWQRVSGFAPLGRGAGGQLDQTVHGEVLGSPPGSHGMSSIAARGVGTPAGSGYGFPVG